MYDKSNCGQHLRKYVGVSLAWWHNYKWATFRICKVFGADFIAPFFHVLFPDRCYDIQKMGLPSITTILSYIRLAYTDFRQDLLTMYNEQHSLSAGSKLLISNLFILMEYMIPAVCTYLFVCMLPGLCVQQFFILVMYL